ncbi:MAG: isoprenylcysteine carboxylmethyltransferase family protein [Limnothrix sp. RL_2_0]|nr:isoprenylcysteine carboxylmethyltransferase family protein [Limnothrix sp. RL_2_0]
MNDRLSRFNIFIYGIICYAIAGGSFLYFIGFVDNLFVPQSLDSTRIVRLSKALFINVLLLGLFALQHSGMARSGFKEKITQIIPPSIERSTYVLCSSLCLITLIVLWQPIGISVWAVENTVLIYLFYALSGLGWVLVCVSTFLTNHFDLFGLRQVYLHFQNKEYTHLEFVTPKLYNFVRHPLYLGFLSGIWFTPTMTISHLVLAIVLTVYILGAIQLEEKDLVDIYGEDYRQYKSRVPMIIPRLLPSKRIKSS